MSNDLSVIPDVPSQPAGPTLLTDFRSTMMMIPSESMPAVFAEFDERRNIFRSWLLSKLVKGVHYGFPPGCKVADDVDPEQWQAKPSLYKAGADFICELMGLSCKYESDVVTWEMLGKPACVCIKCIILNGADKEVGQGRGARQRAEKKMPDNATIKMAEKCAKVNATINALNLSDLFTQDIEDHKPIHENPTSKPDAPRAKPRASRIDAKSLKTLVDLWKSNNAHATKDDWSFYVTRIVGRDFNVFRPDEWTSDEYESVRATVNEEVIGDIPY